MFYDYRFAAYFVLFAVALASLYSGAVALKVRAWEVPLGRGIVLEGRRAVLAGWVLLAIGAAAALALLAGLAA